MRILYIIEAMEGGAKRHVLQLLTHLDRDRFTPALLCSTGRDPRTEGEVQMLRARGIEVTVVPMRREIHPLADFAAYRAILHHLRTHQYGIVHTHCSKAGILGRKAARRAGVPLVVHTPHLLPFTWARGLRRSLYLVVERKAARWTDKIIVLTEGQKRQALDAALCSEDKLAVIPNGISTWSYDREAERQRKRAALDLAPDQPLIGTVARLAPQKGLEVFLHAARRISDRLPRARFLILGEGPLESELRLLSETLGIADRCLWIPHQAKIEAIYCALDVFVLSSFWEGLPYSLLEAMAAGCPIVATSIPGPADVLVDRESALLVPPGDAEAVAEGVVSLLEDPALADSLTQRSREMVGQQYTLEAFVQQTQHLYAALCTPGDLAGAPTAVPADSGAPGRAAP